MAGRSEQNEKAIGLLRRLQIISPILMFFAAGMTYLFLDESLKAILAGLFVFLGITEYFVFGFLAKKLEDQA